MKFLFVHSWQGFSLAEWYLKEALHSRCAFPISVRALDIPTAGIPANDFLVQAIGTWTPDAVGFSCHYWSLPAFLDAASTVKLLLPKARVLLGGPQVNSTAAAEEILMHHNAVDVVIRGAGERPLVRVLEAIAFHKPFDAVDCISFRTDNRIVHMPVRPDPEPGRGVIFHEANTDVMQCISSVSEVSYETVAGCRSRCAYCQYPDGNMTILDDTLIEQELPFLCRHGVRHLRICDAHFGGTRDRAKKIFALLGRVNRQTSIKAYPDLTHVDREYVTLARDAGIEMISIGIESTNPACLRRIGRQATHRHRAAIGLLLREFPDIPADVIVGLPGDSPEGFERTLKDVLDLGFRAINVFRLMLFPGTPMGNDAASFFDGDELHVTAQGQVLASNAFPVSSQSLISKMTQSACIAARLRNTRTALLKYSASLDLMDLLQLLEPCQLLNLSAWTTSRSDPKAARHADEIASCFASYLAAEGPVHEALMRDLARI